MKIAVVLGSPHGLNGNAGLAAQSLIQGVKEAGGLAQVFSLSEYCVLPLYFQAQQ